MEIWKDIKNYEGYYQVSSEGRVRSVERKITQTSRSGAIYYRTIPSRILSPRLDTEGTYLYVNLSKRNIAKNSAVHRLVIKAFLGKGSPNLEAGHRDGNSLNNFSSNLGWLSKKENAQDKKLHGTHLQGSDISASKLVEVDVREIKIALSKYTYGMCTALSKKYGVGPKAISDIRIGRTWKHI